MISFKNDYSEGACPEVLEALVKTNYEQTVGYGEDEYCKEARNLIKENINYSKKENDIGNITEYQNFICELGKLFFKVNRVLKSGAYCLVNVMDIRKKSEFYPLHSDFAIELQKHGYIFDDIIIWDRQQDYNNMKPLGYPYKYRINKVHEYILIFIKK